MTNIFGMALKPPARKIMSGSALEFMNLCHMPALWHDVHYGGGHMNII
jgi:hypothetical protein